jgi:hypothetical protein
VTYRGKDIWEIYTSRSEVEYSTSYAILEAARWKGLTDRELIDLDADEIAKVIAHWETAMQLQAVVRKKGRST